MVSKNPGDSVSVSANAVASKPKWLEWHGGALTGTVTLPSGHRRLVTASPRAKTDYYVNPISIASTTASWRAVIFAPNGSYITSSGTGDTPTVGTPVVRIGTNAPSKAVISFPVMKDSPQNILASTFAGWSDGHTGAVTRGMEVTVEFRNAKTDVMQMAFRGMIYQIESGEMVTVTAYDRMMDLAQYSDQYQSRAGYDQNAESISRTTSGSNYVYTFNNNVGALVSAQAVDTIMIDATGNETNGGTGHSTPNYIIHRLPYYDGYTPQQGRKIKKIKAKFYLNSVWYRSSSSATPGTRISNTMVLYLYQKVGTSFNLIGYKSGSHKVNVSSSNYDDVTVTEEVIFEADVDWTLTDDISTYYVGARCDPAVDDYSYTNTKWMRRSYSQYAEYTTSRLTVQGNYYTSNNGTSWTEIAGTGNLPEIAVGFEHTGGYATVSYFTPLNNTISIAQASVPPGPSYDYISTLDPAIGFIISYFIAGAAGIQGIVKDLIERAGLVQDVALADFGQTTYYSTSTYDYLTCIQELISGSKFGMMASIIEAGKIVIRMQHKTNETPVATFTTAPDGIGEQEIVSHDLTAHWASEKATQAYIAENVTLSGLPIALETDDALMANSLCEVMQSPLRSVITDASLGTHDLLANAGGGKMVQLHTNVFEGKMVLAGYRTDIWDFSQSYVGGNPIKIDVPEYGANGTAVPTEIILGNGVTQVSLDNIRSADRNEISNAMGMTADANSNSASAIPKAVYIFARLNTYETKYGVTPGAIASVSLLDDTGVTHTQSNSNYIKTVKDSAGYWHVLAVFKTADVPGGFATSKPIERVAVTWGGTQRVAVFDNPKYAYGGQNVHVDIRIKSA